MKIIITVIAILFATQSFGQCLGNELAFKDYYKKNVSTLDQIEGIWSTTSVVKIYDQYGALVNTKYNPQLNTLTIIKENGYYLVCSVAGNSRDVETKFYKTATSGIYLYNQFFNKSNSTAKANAILTENGLLEYSYELPVAQLKYDMGSNYVLGYKIISEFKWIKLYPTETEYESFLPSSATGFALSSEGLIATNHHVIKGATKIIVRGVNGDFSKTYKAKVVVEDRNNDLAIIKIDEIDFLSLGSIPYVISNDPSEVGFSIFCLGYPLRATMGDEVKLTSGIISSKSGFQGDITTYQITAPIQPGNSGGPLFDDNGNLIGIINASHTGAENVSYAIKTSYLLNLFDIMPSGIKLQTVSNLKGKILPEQIKIIKNFIYIIETN